LKFQSSKVGRSFLFDFKKNMKFEAKLPEINNTCSYSMHSFNKILCFGYGDLDLYYRYDYMGMMRQVLYYNSTLSDSYNNNGYTKLGCGNTGEISEIEILYKIG